MFEGSGSIARFLTASCPSDPTTISINTCSRRSVNAVASGAMRVAAPLNSCVTSMQPGEGAVAMALMKVSILARSNAGSEQVSMVVRRPLTIWALKLDSSAP